MLRRFALVAALSAALTACGGGGRSHTVPPSAVNAHEPAFAVPPAPPSLAAPPRAALLATTPAAPNRSDRSRRRPSSAASHAAFFSGEVTLDNGVYYLQLANGNVFGYYSYLSDPRYIYHNDLGYAFVADANDGKSGVYLYDFASGHWWYTSPSFAFPYLYDFTRNAVLYYYPDANNAGRYTASPRYFFDFAATGVITLPGPRLVPSRLTFAGGSPVKQGVDVLQNGTEVRATFDASGCGDIASAAPSSFSYAFESVVVSGGRPGSCTLFIIDPGGGRSSLPILVTAGTTGSITEYAHAGSDSQQNIAVDANGNLWFTVLFHDEIVRRTPAGTEKLFPLAAKAHPEYITAGSDGNMWFTEYGANKIGRITPAGAITEFTLPTADSQPSCITQGPDGALWFGEAGHAAVGRITTAGAITEYPAPYTTSETSGIVTGPDGNLWYTTAWPANTIARITPAGALTQYRIPSAGASSVAVGPDGAIWFTETDSGLIGRITMTGSIKEYSRPSTFYDQPLEITAGPDGNMWFTEFQGGKIGRITPAGWVDEFPLPTRNEFPVGIVQGSDGALWFTAARGGLGRITP
jgi:streptogramin lyase